MYENELSRSLNTNHQPLDTTDTNYSDNSSAGRHNGSEIEHEVGTDQVIYTILLIVILVFGLVGNFAFMYVTFKVPSMRTVLNIYLMNLCVADTLFLVTGIPTEIYLHHREDVNMNIASFMHSIFSSIPQIASLFIMALVSIERYVGICHPFRARYLHRRSRIRASVMACWICGVLLSLPYTLCAIIMSKVLFTITLLCQLLAFMVSMCVVIVLYTMIICKLRKEEQALANTMSGVLHDRKQVIVLLIVTTFVFFICVSPEYVFYFEMLLYSVGAIPEMEEKQLALQLLAKTLLFLNSAINALIYNVTCSRYREAFKKAFAGWKCTSKHKQANSDGTITPRSRPGSRHLSVTTVCDIGTQTDDLYVLEDDIGTHM